MMQDFVKSTGAKSWNLISMDYASGQSFSKAFRTWWRHRRRAAEPVRAHRHQRLRQPHLAALEAGDALVVTLFMSDGPTFAKQSRQFGLFDKYKMSRATASPPTSSSRRTATTCSASSTAELDARAAGAPLYVKDFVLRVKASPVHRRRRIAALEVFRASVVKAKSTEPGQSAQGARGLKVDTLFGNAEMRADHHLIASTAWRRWSVARRQDRLQDEGQAGPGDLPAAQPGCKASS